MQQAIEEGFILDVLKRYTTYQMAFRLEQKQGMPDEEVDKGRAATRVFQWVKLHPYNIEQKVQVIVEHFRQHVAGLLAGQAKAMVVTDSRKAAVRYKLALDKYVHEHSYEDVHALVAFSGDVEDTDSGPELFNERNMNLGLKGRDLRDAFDTDEFQVMIVANKFQTGFDQPKLCAMYVDKKLSGVDCVQTLSRLNRTYPDKDESFVLDFVNHPDDILDAFKPYYRTAELADVSDPNLIYDLQDKLQAEHIFTWAEVEAFADAFFDPKQTQDKLNYLVRPAVDRYRDRYRTAIESLKSAKRAQREAEERNDDAALANARADEKQAAEDKSTLDMFRKDLGSFVRFYEFMSQIVAFDDADLEKLSVYARHLRPLLRENLPVEDIDVSSLELEHYRLRKIKEQEIKLGKDDGDHPLQPGEGLGSGKPHERDKGPFSEIIARLNDLFADEEKTDGDRLSYLNTIKTKVLEDDRVVQQIDNNAPNQVMLGDYPGAVQDAVMDSLGKHSDLAGRLLQDEQLAERFAQLLLDAILLDRSQTNRVSV